jgi:hypothetical protein
LFLVLLLLVLVLTLRHVSLPWNVESGPQRRGPRIQCRGAPAASRVGRHRTGCKENAGT